MQIFPKEFLKYSKEYYLNTITSKSQIIYLVTLLTVVGILISLPLIKVDTFTQSRGIVKTSAEQHIIYSAVTAPIQNLNTSENNAVNMEDTLIVFENTHLKTSIAAKKYDKELYSYYINDLRELIKSITNSNITVKLKSDLIEKEYNAYLERVNEALFNIEINEKKYIRHKLLLENDIITKEDFEIVEHAYDSAHNKYEQLVSSSLSNWQSRLKQYEQNIKILKAELENLEQLNKQYFIISPLDGTIQEFQGFQVGSMVLQNQMIAKISPEAELIAEVWIKPQYVGLINENQKVSFHVDAFNYREWGKITGKVNEISNDAIIVENIPYFKIRCTLDQNYLKLKNGYQGNLKKGMTLTANFLLRKRSLYNLLFDKIDDWVNPSTNIANEEIN